MIGRWDITIRCESEIEQQNLVRKLRGGWILCSEKMPEERETMFAKLKGTNKWSSTMPEAISDNVIVTVKFNETGETISAICHTCDGKWMKSFVWEEGEVIAWMLLPEPYRDNALTFERSTSCGDCPCFNDHTGECQAAEKELSTNLEIPEWCPVKVIMEYQEFFDLRYINAFCEFISTKNGTDCK